MPLVVLALGAVLAGFVGVPAALGGGSAIEHVDQVIGQAVHRGGVGPRHACGRHHASVSLAHDLFPYVAMVGDFGEVGIFER